MQIDWRSKLTSRKFWISIVGFIVPLLMAFGFSENQITEISAIIMAGSQLIAYVIGESVVDASRLVATKNNCINQDSQISEEDIII